MSSRKSSGSKTSPRKPAPEPAVEALSAILQAAATAVRSWSPSDLHAFLAGERDLVLRAPRAARRQAPSDEMTVHAVEKIRAALGAMDSRERGMAYLEDAGFSRDELRRVVAALDLRANRSDNMERLRLRIVEALIGYRLRSEAIRGHDPDAPASD